MDSMSPLPGQALFELNPRCRKMQEPNYVNLVVSMYAGAIPPLPTPASSSSIS